MRYDNFIPEPRLVKICSRGRLPHWQVDDAVYFITFRLNDSLPREVARRLILERQRMMRGLKTVADRIRADRAFGFELDRHLDAGYGSCILREHGEIVAGALRFFDRDRYDLHAWCVMPNHVHAMIFLSKGKDVPNILHSWKSYTAHEIGRGRIWQREYFDRVVRSPREYEETSAYIRANPGKAGLQDWRWVG